MECERLDRGTLGKAERTPQGGLRAPGRVTRTGVFLYRNDDGSIRREYRPADEVFHADSLASLRSAPVTVLHPRSGKVDTRSWREDAVGHVEDPAADGTFVGCAVVVQDAAVVDRIERRDLSDFSAGYTCRVDATPGVTPDGESYDVVQRNIRYNHVALGPAGWGRAGPDARIRLDQADEETMTEKVIYKTRIDGKDYEVGSTEHVAKLDSLVESLRTDVTTEKARADKAEAELVAERDPVKFRARVAARASLEARALTVCGEAKRADKSDREIAVEILGKLRPTFVTEGRSDEALTGALDAFAAEAPPIDGKLRADATHGNTGDEIAAARAKRDESIGSAWTKPLTATR